MKSKSKPLPDSLSLKEKKGEESTGMASGEILWGANMKMPPPPKWLVSGLIPLKNKITSIFGDGGTGKSYLATYLATCLLRQKAFLGVPIENPFEGPILYVDYELDEEEFQRRAFLIARGLGYERPPDNLGYLYLDEPITPCNVLKSYVEVNKPKLLILDSLTMAAYSADMNEAKAVIAVMKALEKLQLPIITIDHITKNAAEIGAKNPKPIGSVFKHNVGRSMMFLDRRPNGVMRLIPTKLTFGKMSDPIFYELKIDEEQEIASFAVLPDDDPKVVSVITPKAEKTKIIYTIVKKQERKVEEIRAILLDKYNIKLAVKTIENYLTGMKKKGLVDNYKDGFWGAADLPATPVAKAA